MITKSINFCKDNQKDIYLAAVMILIAAISFGLGRLSKIREEKTPITIEAMNISTTTPIADKFSANDNNKNYANNGDKIFVASRNGKKYYYAWCDATKTIKEGNKVYFSTKEEAVKAGFEPAGNCRGLK